MSDLPSTTNPSLQDPTPDQASDVRAYMAILWRYKWELLVIVLLASGAAFVRTMYLVPEVYRSDTSLLALRSGGGNALDMMANAGGLGSVLGRLGLSQGAAEAGRLVDIMGSRGFREEVAEDLAVTPIFVADSIADSKAEGPLDADSVDAVGIALALVQAHPAIVRFVSRDDPDSGILSMSDERLEKLVSEVAPSGELPPGATLGDVRDAWQRLVGRAMESFAQGVVIRTTSDDVVTVSVEVESDPHLAARIANEYVDRLESYLRETTLTQAQRYRQFLEAYVHSVEADLLASEQKLESFKIDHGLLSLPEQVAQWVRSASEVRAELNAKQLARDVLLQTGVSLQNPRVRTLSSEITGLSERAADIERGQADTLDGARVRDVPTLERQLAELTRDNLVQDTLYRLLRQEYEMAKLAEARDETSFTRLDLAQPAIEPIRPKHRRDMMIGVVVGLSLAILYALAREHTRERKPSESPPIAGG